MALVVEKKLNVFEDEDERLPSQKKTFEDICPIWSQRLKRKLDGQELFELHCRADRCIVGEAYGFKPPLIDGKFYGDCKECGDHSNSFGTDHTEEAEIQAFVDHWNEAHT